MSILRSQKKWGCSILKEKKQHTHTHTETNKELVFFLKKKKIELLSFLENQITFKKMKFSKKKKKANLHGKLNIGPFFQ